MRLLSPNVSSTVSTEPCRLVQEGKLVSPSVPSRTWPVVISSLGCTLLLLPACAPQFKFPPMGEPLSSSARLEATPSIKNLTIRYTDSCGQPQEIPIGEQLEAALREGFRRTFKPVDESSGSEAVTDHVVQVDLVNSSFTLKKDGLYDRVPADLRLSAHAKVSNRAGDVIRESDISIARQERLRLEQLAKNCNYMIDPFVHDAVVDFATRVSFDAKLAVSGQASPASTVPALPTSDITSGSTSMESAGALRFKAILLDENNNLIFEGGEHLRVRIDVINIGVTPIEQATASLIGTPSIIQQFPTTTLRIPPLQPGQTKSLEFIATLPVTVQPIQAEIHVTITDTSGVTTPSQTLFFTVELPNGRK